MKPILRDFSESFESERLIIRCPRPGDGPALNEAICESWAELKPWLPWAAGEMPTVAESEAKMRQAQAQFLSREDLWLLFFLKDGQTFVGSSGFHRINWDVPKVEIGYWVRTKFSGQGYITEGVRAMTHFAFATLGVARVEIRCDAQNYRSAAIPRRLGFSHEGTLAHDSRHHLTQELRDTMIFAKVAGR